MCTCVESLSDNTAFRKLKLLANMSSHEFMGESMSSLRLGKQ